MRAQLQNLIDDTRGLSMAEYTVLFVVIAVATLTLWVKFGKQLEGIFI